MGAKIEKNKRLTITKKCAELGVNQCELVVILNNTCEYQAKHEKIVCIYMHEHINDQAIKKLLHFAAQIFTELCFKGLSYKRE